MRQALRLATMCLALDLFVTSSFASDLRKPVSKGSVQENKGAFVAKIAVINTQAFADSKTGIKRLVAAHEALAKEFEPQRKEIEELRDKAQKLATEIQAKQNTASEDVLRKKRDELENMGKEIGRKQQDAQQALNRRMSVLAGPINKEIVEALEAYSRQMGIDVLLDLSKMEGVVLVANPKVDLTSTFISEFNSKHP